MSMHHQEEALLSLLGIDLPIIQKAPKAGTPALAAAVTNAGGLGAIGVGALDAAAARQMIEELRSLTPGSFHVNLPGKRLAKADGMLKMLLETRPRVVSFHAGLPAHGVITALQQAGIVLMAAATTLDDAQAIAAAGIDVIVAQGKEKKQPDSLALARSVVCHVQIPVIAAGGIRDGAGIAAALRLGAAGVQVNTSARKLSPAALMAQLADELWIA